MRLSILLSILSFALSWTVGTLIFQSVQRGPTDKESQRQVALSVGPPVENVSNRNVPMRSSVAKNIATVSQDSLLANTKSVELPDLSDLDRAILNDPNSSRGQAGALRVAIMLALRKELNSHAKNCFRRKKGDPTTLGVKLTIDSDDNEARVKSLDGAIVRSGAPLDDENIDCVVSAMRHATGKSISPPTGKKFPFLSGTAEIMMSFCGAK